MEIRGNILNRIYDLQEGQMQFSETVLVWIPFSFVQHSSRSEIPPPTRWKLKKIIGIY